MQNKQTENAILLRLIKIVNTVLFGNRGIFAVNQSLKL